MRTKQAAGELASALVDYAAAHPYGLTGAGLSALGAGALLARRKTLGALLTGLGLSGLGLEALPILSQAAESAELVRRFRRKNTTLYKTPGQVWASSLGNYLKLHRSGILGTGLVAAGGAASLARHRLLGLLLASLGLANLGRDAARTVVVDTAIKRSLPEFSNNKQR